MALRQLPEDLLQRLETVARKRELSSAELLDQLLRPYEPAPPVDPQQEADEVRQVMLRIYERARRYWHEHGDPRANMTYEELDEQFWLIDYEGIPRLKSEQGTIEVPPSGLEILAELADEDLFSNSPSDVSQHSREILNTEFADYLWKRMHGGEDVEESID